MHPMVYWVKRARVDMPFKLPLTMVPDVLLWITGTPYHAGFSPVLEATKHQSNYCSSLFKHTTSSNNLFHPEKSPLIHLLTHCTPLVSGSECCIFQIIEQPINPNWMGWGLVIILKLLLSFFKQINLSFVLLFSLCHLFFFHFLFCFLLVFPQSCSF